MLLRFDSLFGSGALQIPSGAKISSAKLSLTTDKNSADGSTSKFSIDRLLKSFTETSTWDSLVNGISADGVEAFSTADSSLTPGGVGKVVTFDVTKSLQAWAAGSKNLGWAVLTTGTDAWRVDSSEFSSVALRPLLQVSYSTTSSASKQSLEVVPEPAGAVLLAGGAGATLLRRRRRGA
jgi:hypothetical protein